MYSCLQIVTKVCTRNTYRKENLRKHQHDFVSDLVWCGSLSLFKLSFVFGLRIAVSNVQSQYNLLKIDNNFFVDFIL